MNHLSMIKAALIKKQRLNEAQQLMAKAYRGVAYTDAHHGRPEPQRSTDLKYRGLRYSV